MAESSYRLPPDSTGKRIRTRTRVINGDEVHDQAVFLSGRETWMAYADAVVPAQNKHHLSIFNGVGTGKVLRVIKLFSVNLQTSAAAGAVLRFDLRRTTAQAVGTTITPVPQDMSESVLPAGVFVATGATVTDGPILYPYLTLSEELTTSQPLTNAMFQQFQNILIESPEAKELVLREGQGFTVKQVTSSTVGSFGWILTFTVE